MHILSKPGQPPPDPDRNDHSPGAGPGLTSKAQSAISLPHPPPAPSSHTGISHSRRSQEQTQSHPSPSAVSQQHLAAYQQAPGRRGSVPFSFPLLFSNSGQTSSTSLAPSIAEGKTLPIDHTTAAHRTSALRQFNVNNPSSYAKATSTKSATYSQPVIVRTYSGGSSSQNPGSSARSHGGHYGPPSVIHRNPPRFLSSAHSTTAVSTKSAPLPRPITITTSRSSGNVKPTIAAMSSTKTRTKPKAYWPWKFLDSGHGQEPKLPPMEAFSFKGFLADLEDSELNSNIDGIAEICARSKYSLSNQYEVHMTPHGSGEGFLAGSRPPPSGRKRRQRREQGPTLQAVQSDDDESQGRGYRRRRGPGRRRSMAYGTLETIMSSSRSSEEDKSKKKSAAELADEVRNRAAQGSSGPSGEGSGSGSTTQGVVGEDSNGVEHDAAEAHRRTKRRESTSFAHAIIDSTRHSSHADATSPRGSASALVSGPAPPQASSSHLEIRTTPVGPLALYDSGESSPTSVTGSLTDVRDNLDGSTRVDDAHPVETTTAAATGSFWVPWRSTDTDSRPSKARSDAERNLRGLLGTG